MEDVGIFYVWPFGIFFLVLVCCAKKNLATLDLRHQSRKEGGGGVVAKIFEIGFGWGGGWGIC
jgi:hypothetical protein